MKTELKRQTKGLALRAAWVGLILLLAVGGAAAAPGTAQVVTIGFAGALSGGAQGIGWPEANAVQLAVDQVNASGGLDIGGTAYQVALVLADDQCDPDQGAAAAQALLDAGAVGAVGHTCSAATIAAEPVYAAAGTAAISPSATGPAVTQQGFDIIFRTVPHDGSRWAQLARQFRRGMGLERSSIVAFDGAVPAPSGYYSATFTHLAGTVTGYHLVGNTSEFTATLQTIIQNEQPDALLYADVDPTRAGLFSRAAFDLGLGDVPLGWSTEDAGDWVLPVYAAAAGDAAAGDVIAMQYRRLEEMPGWPQFLADYLAAGFPNYGDDPTPSGAFAYDAARILLAAIDRADSLDPAAIRDQVAATADHVGVVGTYRGFDPHGDVLPQWGWLEQNRQGKWTDMQVYTWEYGFDDPTLHPLWSWVREDPAHWSLADRPGALRIVTQPGALYGADNNQDNLLLLPAPPGDFYLTAWLDFAPTEDFQQAGLLLYQDDDNYVQLSRVYAYGDGVEMIAEVDGSAELEGVVESATGLYLQLQRRGDTVEGYYSLDGIQWTPVWRVTAPLAHLQVGLGAAHDVAGATAIPADFDEFALVGGLPQRDDGRADHFDQDLDPRWSWVREDPAYWSLDDRPGYLQITTQPGPARNLLLQSAPSAAFQADTRLLFTPEENYQIAGLLLYQDDDNRLLLGRAFCDNPDGCVNNGIYFDHVEGGAIIGSNFATAVALPYLAHLRVARAGDEYWGFYGEDGIYWTLIGHHQAGPGFHPARIGLTATNQTPGASAIPAAFDWFRIEADWLRVYAPLLLRDAAP